jgi:hypothetical protein
MDEAKLSNIAAFKKFPAFAGMTTHAICEFIIVIKINFYNQLAKLVKNI